jgi:hypothetical protein
MAHLDVKKVSRIPDGGGWRAHGRDSQQAKTVDRAKAASARHGYVYLHSIVDGLSRLAYIEPLLDFALASPTSSSPIARRRGALSRVREHGAPRGQQRTLAPTLRQPVEAPHGRIAGTRVPSRLSGSDHHDSEGMSYRET